MTRRGLRAVWVCALLVVPCWQRVLGQGSPIQGQAVVTYRASHAVVPPGETFEVSLSFDLTGLTGAGCDGVRMPVLLGGYQLGVAFDPLRVLFEGATRCPGTPGSFGDPAFTSPQNANPTGRLTLMKARRVGEQEWDERGCYAILRFRAQEVPGVTRLDLGLPSWHSGSAAALCSDLVVCRPHSEGPVRIPANLARSIDVYVADPQGSVSLSQTTCSPGSAGATLSMIAARHPQEEVALREALARAVSCEDPLVLSIAGTAVGDGDLIPSGTWPLTATCPATTASATIPIRVRRQGDLDENDRVDVFDVVGLASHLVGNVEAGRAPFTAPLPSADTETNGTIDLFDLVNLAGFVVGNVTCLTP